MTLLGRVTRPYRNGSEGSRRFLQDKIDRPCDVFEHTGRRFGQLVESLLLVAVVKVHRKLSK